MNEYEKSVAHRKIGNAFFASCLKNVMNWVFYIAFHFVFGR